MRVLFVSGELIAGDLAYRLKLEGCDVKLFVEHSEQKHCLDGFVDKTDDWKKELDWVGKDGLIVFDDVGYGKIQDDLRKEGYRVVGGSEGGDKLEQDREFGQKIFSQSGMNVVPIFNFETADEAAKFIMDQGGSWVIKQNDHQSALNYVGMLDDGSDVLGVLENYRILGITNLSLQRKLNGIEIAVGRFFNGADWVGPAEINIEHKSFMNGNIGPKTGEMGTLVWYVQDRENKLFDETLSRLKPYLQECGFKGTIDINCFVDHENVYPIEATARFGCPIIHLQSDMHLSNWSDFLGAVADGKDFDLKVQDGYGIILTIAVPPFPYGNEDGINNFSAEGMRVLFSGDLSQDEKERIHFEGVSLEMEPNGSSQYVMTKNIGYAAFVGGVGKSVEFAQEQAYSLVKKMVVPKMMYRTDIGDEFVKKNKEDLLSWGWI
ncbi:MAG: hypothetical protein WAV46_04720 [Candidatus Moraniibacteriota bacterium]